MSDILDVESTLTDRYQTTVPETVRRALRLAQRLQALVGDAEVDLAASLLADDE